MSGFPAWDTKLRGVKTSSTSEMVFSQAHQPRQQLFGPATEPSAERRPTGIALPRFVPISLTDLGRFFAAELHGGFGRNPERGCGAAAESG